jgi:hypothetical protein
MQKEAVGRAFGVKMGPTANSLDRERNLCYTFPWILEDRTSTISHWTELRMNDEKMAFEAMMNEIEDSDSDTEFEIIRKKSPAIAQSKSKHSSEHDYHQSKSSKREHDGAKSHDNSVRERPHSPPQASSKYLKAHITTNVEAMSRNHEAQIENFGAKCTGASSNDKEKSGANQHSDFMASKNWLMRSCHPHDPTTLCYVMREKSLVGGLTLRVYIEPKNDSGMFISFDHSTMC